jgi:hypothetical protein
MQFSLSRPRRHLAAIAGAILFCLWSAGWQPVSAAPAHGPFADFRGHWSGSGTIREEGSRPERIRCEANYRILDSSAHEVELDLKCDSDSYKFDLSGQFQANSHNQVSGHWTERTRGIGGQGFGFARGSSTQVHVESGAFAATVFMVTRSRSQSVRIDSHVAGKAVKASISLHRH